MFKQKPKYEKPDARIQWVGIEKVFTASQVSFDDTGSVSSEGFELDDEQITF